VHLPSATTLIAEICTRTALLVCNYFCVCFANTLLL